MNNISSGQIQVYNDVDMKASQLRENSEIPYKSDKNAKCLKLTLQYKNKLAGYSPHASKGKIIFRMSVISARVWHLV